ncbi:MAG TPA: helix-turn-helix transcriptional regulator [Streptosporangiaceae bacterium]|nr:helix-turn-helix transcriptional regulator [Streptosporangiaceae bacterium]
MDAIRATGNPHDRLAAEARPGPTAARMLVGIRLRRLREGAGVTREAAADEIRSSDSKISRLELGRTGFKRRDVADLLTLYGVTDEGERQALLELAQQANKPGWWQRYDEVVPSWFESYLGLEQAASVIRNYAVQFVPDLLQTEEYARAALRLCHPDDDSTRLGRRVALRMGRQQILHRPNPPKVWAVIDETALRRPIGSRATMRLQLGHLIDIAELPHVSVQVLPFSTGGHPAAGGAIAFLRFAAGDLPDIVYLEQLITAVYFDKPDAVAPYWRILNHLGMQAEQPHATTRILHRIRAEI